jgi:thiamine-phosphate pyrophosphorylase
MERLQYISQETEKLTHLQGIEKACKAGVKWIQLRIKDKSPEEVLELAKQAKIICDKYDAVLTVNDHTHVAKEINAYGLHLGKEDMSISEARKLTNNAFIIGGTANTIEDIEMHFKAGANYVGVGPFRFTTTKKKLSPVLGLEGYKKIVDECNKRNIMIPLIAIGGIELKDIPAIMQTGVFGIAVSGLIANSDNAEETVKQIFESINPPITTPC